MKRKDMDSEKKTKKRSGRHWLMPVATIGIILVCVLAALFLRFQLKRYEKGILDVCATQQDAYVQLVIDQINLKENRSDEEIITDILGTMDASSNKYWTFSSNQAMLFVKDVLETNKYKGFTTATYYASDSAKKFLDSLQTNRVIHSEIEIDDSLYIASGSAFAYNGNSYRICLLTNKSVLLDNNQFLGAKTELVTLVAVLLMLLMLSVMILAQKISRQQKKLEEQEYTVGTLSRSLTKMNQRLSEQDLHDTRNNVWSQAALEGFLQKLKERNAVPLVLVTMKCESREVRKEILEKAAVLLDRTVLRFEQKENGAAFLFVQCTLENALLAVRALELGRAAVTDKILLLEDGNGEFRTIEKSTAGKEKR